MVTASAIISVLGGEDRPDVALALRLGVSSQAVRTWRKNNRFPARVKRSLRAMARSRGMVIPDDFFHPTGKPGPRKGSKYGKRKAEDRDAAE